MGKVPNHTFPWNCLMIDWQTEIESFGLDSKDLIPVESGCYIISTGPERDWIKRVPFGLLYVDKQIAIQETLESLFQTAAIQYIGSSKWVNLRFHRGHEVVRSLKQFGADYRSIVISVIACHESNRKELEQELITFLCPSLNLERL